MNLVIHAYGEELRDEVETSLPKILRLVLDGIELHPGDTEVLADAVGTDIDGAEFRLGVASFTLDELAERYPNLGLAWWLVPFSSDLDLGRPVVDHRPSWPMNSNKSSSRAPETVRPRTPA